MPKHQSTSARGYGHAHQQMRELWQPVVDEGDGICHAVVCLLPTRAIEPGTPWHLGHTPDRTGWTGPEHERCNTSEGATRGNAQRRGKPKRTTELPTSPRRWQLY